MEEFEIKGLTYRIKKMNAIELLAIRSSISFEDYEKLVKCYDTLLTKVEVKVKDSWIQVKQGNDFYPSELETDPIAIEEIVKKVFTYIASVFQKSSSSN